MLGRCRKLFIVKVMQQSRDAPFVFVFPELAGVGAHAGFHGQHVLAQAFGLGVLTQQAPGGRAICHDFALLSPFILCVSLGIMPDRASAWSLLCEYSQSKSLRKQMLAVEACM